jgi:uncharacterized membrane protein YccC
MPDPLDQNGLVAQRRASPWHSAWAHAVQAGPPLLFGLRLWTAVCLSLYLAFWLELDSAYWAGTSAALVCQPHLGASLRKGWFRITGTLVGAVSIVALTAVFPQSRAGFLIGLALWGGICAFVASILRNFAAYAAALAGFTAAIIAGNELGAVGGVNGQAFSLALARTSEIWIGIVCAGIVLAGTDLGSAPRRLATLMASISSRIASLFAGTLRHAGSSAMDTQPARHELIRRVIALDPVFDEAIGESTRLRCHSPALEKAIDGLFDAIAAWRIAAVRLKYLPDEESQQDADGVMQFVPEELPSTLLADDPACWINDPIGLRNQCGLALRRLASAPANTPSQRLLVDQTTTVLTSLSQALDGLDLLRGNVARHLLPRHRAGIYVPDWLPALVHGARAFVTIGTVELFWIMTEWPDGALAITWAAIVVIVFAARADEAYSTAAKFTAGTGLAAIFAAIVLLAALPRVETFAGFAFVMGLYLIPIGALTAYPSQAAIFMPMAGNFLPLLSPANQMSYDDLQFYNVTLAVVAGCVIGALSFRLLPPLSPQFRSRRLLGLTLRDLRRLAANPTGKSSKDWKRRLYSRLEALPEKAEPLQRAQLLAALSVGTEIIHLDQLAARIGFLFELKLALEDLGRGNSQDARTRLAELDRGLSAISDRSDVAPLAAHARSRILAIRDALVQHHEYFGSGSGA